MNDDLPEPLKLTDFYSFMAITFFKAASFQDSCSHEGALALRELVGVYFQDQSCAEILNPFIYGELISWISDASFFESCRTMPPEMSSIWAV